MHPPSMACTVWLQLSCAGVAVHRVRHSTACLLPAAIWAYGLPDVDVLLAVQWQVHGGAISAVTRMEAQHGMRPLSQTQGPFALTGSAPWEKYLTAKYNPHDEVKSHRTRSPAWALPPNRSALNAPLPAG